MATSDDYLLGVNIGTSSSTGIIINTELDVIDSAMVEQSVSNPQPG